MWCSVSTMFGPSDFAHAAQELFLSVLFFATDLSVENSEK